MKVSIFGLGYVGCVTAACLASQGHRVIGVDVVPEKAEAINSGRWPIYEPGLESLLKNARGRIEATTDGVRAVLESEITLICVGTPSLSDGSVDTTYLRKTVSIIAKALAKHSNKKHHLLIRSTSPPGTCEEVLFPLLSPAQRKRTAFYPEFLREGTAVKDFFEPSLNVIGAAKGYSPAAVKRLLPKVKAPIEIVSVRTAEAIKYANNSFHALKIAFTNEIALFCKSRGANSDEVMQLFCKDTKLNLSPYYMRPGFAYGGSCLPKELRAMIASAKQTDLHATLFEAAIRSNDRMIEALVALLNDLKAKAIGYAGATFKPDTDDFRESPVLRAASLIGGPAPTYRVKVKQFVLETPKASARLSELDAASYLLPVDSLKSLIKLCDVIVLGPLRLSAPQESLLARSGRTIVDLKWFRYSEKLVKSKGYRSLV